MFCLLSSISILDLIASFSFFVFPLISLAHHLRYFLGNSIIQRKANGVGKETNF
jgi:hypothetical protein